MITTRYAAHGEMFKRETTTDDPGNARMTSIVPRSRCSMLHPGQDIVQPCQPPATTRAGTTRACSTATPVPARARGRKYQKTLTAAIATAMCLAGIQASMADDEHADLAHLMTRAQYFMHKTGLAIDQRNAPLIDYYLHELEETLEEIAEIDTYSGVAVGALAKKTIMPAFEKLEKSAESGDHSQMDTHFDDLIAACNLCHVSSERPYLVMERQRHSPFAQSFAAPTGTAAPESD